MTRIDLLSDGRLLELLTEDALDHDSGYEIVRVRLAVLAEVARRLSRKEAQR